MSTLKINEKAYNTIDHIKGIAWAFLVCVPLLWLGYPVACGFKNVRLEIIIVGYMVQLLITVLMWLFKKRAVVWKLYELFVIAFMAMIVFIPVYITMFPLNPFVFYGFCFLCLLVYILSYKGIKEVYNDVIEGKIKNRTLNLDTCEYLLTDMGSVDFKKVSQTFFIKMLKWLTSVSAVFAGSFALLGVLVSKSVGVNHVAIFLIFGLLFLVLMFPLAERTLHVEWISFWEKKNGKVMKSMFLN